MLRSDDRSDDHFSSLCDKLSSDKRPLAINGDYVSILQDPTNFYEELRTQIAGAKRHIALSALYLGTDELESKLLGDLDKALEKERELRITLIFDYNRAMRTFTKNKANNNGDGDGDTATTVPQYHILLPLLRKHGTDRVRVQLYDMPSASSPTNQVLRRRMLPEQIREVLGVYHVKFALFDDKVIVTGANLSEEYFVSRQDRYFLVTHGLATFFERYCKVFGGFCFAVQPDGTMSAPALDAARDGAVLQQITDTLHRSGKEGERQREEEEEEADTIALPIMQHARAGITEESQLLPHILDHLARIGTSTSSSNSSSDSGVSCESLVVASPYPSFRPAFAGAITSAARAIMTQYSSRHSHGIDSSTDGGDGARVAIVSAAGASHGFGSAPGLGVKALIPKLHDQVLADSLFRGGAGSGRDDIMGSVSPSSSSSSSSSGGSSPVDVLKYHREGWTFHSKGIWAELTAAYKDSGGDDDDDVAADGGATTQIQGQGRRQAVASLTYVGSSNMGERSVRRDMELGFVVVTRNPALQAGLQAEVARTLRYCGRVPLGDLIPNNASINASGGGKPGLKGSLGVLMHSKRSISLLAKLFRTVL
jgi:CDP-diacylglycerol--glycerol-3-phosphate 3-phosphatidyltransferase